MESAKQLAKRFRELFLNGFWIANTNYQELLNTIDLKQASQKVDSLNTITALVFHINYYVEGVLKVFEGGDLTIRDQYSFDGPELNSENDWKKLKNRLFSNSEAFTKHIENMNEAQLETTFVDEKYGTYRRNIEGLIEHSYYHFGQIALLQKLTESNYHKK